MARNFTFAVPARGHWSTYTNLQIETNNVYKYEKVMKYWGSFDMSVCHARYNRTVTDRIVLNATYVTLIRNPVGRFVSAFIYYNYSRQANLTYSKNALSKFFEVKISSTRSAMEVTS